MIMYLNAHIATDQLRHRNECQGKIGAKVGVSLFLTFREITVVSYHYSVCTTSLYIAIVKWIRVVVWYFKSLAKLTCLTTTLFMPRGGTSASRAKRQLVT